VNKTVLITGGTGFVGSHVVEAYLASGWNVRALVRDPRRLKWLSGLNADFVEGRLNDVASLQRAVEGCTTVVHCAALTKAVHAREYFQINAEATATFAKAAREAGVNRFIFCSSQAAAGPAPLGQVSREDDPEIPITDYGRSKLAGEQSLRSEAGSMEWIIVRPPAVIGPRDEQFLSLFQGVVKYGRYPLFGGTKFEYSFVCVHDLTKALHLAGTATSGANSVYYVCNDETLTWGGAASIIGEIIHRRVKPLVLPKPMLSVMGFGSSIYSALSRKPALLSRDKLNEILTPGWVCSGEKIKKAWGFNCTCSIRQTLAETYDFYVREKWL
jgi:dihydroflavonol-4-reductase